MSVTISKATNYGLPAWIPGDYLTAVQTRALGELDLCAGLPTGYCAICGVTAPLDRAHIVRKGLGGRQKGESGPTVRLCRPCHEGLDRDSRRSLAVRRDAQVCFLVHDEHQRTGVRAQPLGIWVKP